MCRATVSTPQTCRLAVLLLTCILGPGSAAAAQPGSLQGEVLDPQGLRVPDASIVVTLESGEVLETTSTVLRDGFAPRTVGVQRHRRRNFDWPLGL